MSADNNERLSALLAMSLMGRLVTHDLDGCLYWIRSVNREGYVQLSDARRDVDSKNLDDARIGLGKFDRCWEDPRRLKASPLRVLPELPRREPFISPDLLGVDTDDEETK